LAVGDRWITERLALGHRSNLLRATRRMEAAPDRTTRRWKEDLKQCAD
jgi:hypothetical protein